MDRGEIGERAGERGNFQSFLNELCDLLRVPGVRAAGRDKSAPLGRGETGKGEGSGWAVVLRLSVDNGGCRSRRLSGGGGSRERGNFQSFLNELCDLLRVPGVRAAGRDKSAPLGRGETGKGEGSAEGPMRGWCFSPSGRHRTPFEGRFLLMWRSVGGETCKRVGGS